MQIGKTLAIRLETLTYPAHLFAKKVPVPLRNSFRGGIESAQRARRKLPTAVADHEVSKSGGWESLSRRASSIAQGRNGDKSSGGVPLFSAHAVRYDLTQ